MPRADRGSLAVDVSLIMSLNAERLEELVSIAVSTGAIVVTAPSIVPVWVSGRPLRVVLGVGSIVFPPTVRAELERLGIRPLELSAPEWVEGCRAAASSPIQVRRLSGTGEVSGRLVPGDLRDPLALLVAGAEGSAEKPAEKLPPIAALSGEPVAWYSGDTVETTLTDEGEAADRLRLASRILGLCRVPG